MSDLRALYFGTYDRSYPRNAQVISCLRSAGVDVVERHRHAWGARESWTAGLPQLARVAASQVSLLREGGTTADVVIVGYPGHLDLPAARRVAAGRPVVFNPLLSMHDTLVSDRRRFRPGSLGARIVWAVDRRAFRHADVVVADTAAHAAFMREQFSLGDDRIKVCFIGADDRIFVPGPARFGVPFHALFVGKLIPLHGLEVILAAARLVSEVPFRIVGSGQLEAQLAHAPPNVEWVRWLEYEELPAAYHACGCALGIFGRGAKTTRVIPNKAFHAMACGRPLITADTPAARELLRHEHDALLVPAGDPEALATALRRIASDERLAAALGARARETYESRASEVVLGRQWRALLEQAVRSR